MTIENLVATKKTKTDMIFKQIKHSVVYLQSYYIIVFEFKLDLPGLGY